MKTAKKKQGVSVNHGADAKCTYDGGCIGRTSSKEAVGSLDEYNPVLYHVSLTSLQQLPVPLQGGIFVLKPSPRLLGRKENTKKAKNSRSSELRQNNHQTPPHGSGNPRCCVVLRVEE